MVNIILLINRCIKTTLVEVIDNSLLGNLVNETVAVDKILINFVYKVPPELPAKEADEKDCFPNILQDYPA